MLVVDNSLSMGYQQLDRTLLDEARAKAKEFLDELPLGSRISVAAVCGSAGGFSLDAYRTNEDARDALDKIEVVDRRARRRQAADLARQASPVPELPAKRVVVYRRPAADRLAERIARRRSSRLCPSCKSSRMAEDEPENTWVADFSLMDGIADVETPALFSATIRHEGPTAAATCR